MLLFHFLNTIFTDHNNIEPHQLHIKFFHCSVLNFEFKLTITSAIIVE